MRKVRTDDGIELALFEQGPAEAPVIVLVHGFPDDHRVWAGVIEVLARRYRVAAYDTRGTSDSTAPPGREGFKLERLASDLRAVIDAASPNRRAHVVGHDWGGIQAWEAVADRDISARVASFTTISGPCLDHAGAWLRRAPAGAFARQLASSWYVAAFQAPGVAELMWHSPVGKTWPAFLQRVERVPRSAVEVPTTDSIVRALDLYRANILERLLSPRVRRVSRPVQVIAPRGDRYVSPALSKSASSWADELFYREVEGGHWIVRAKPTRVARWIEDLVEYAEGRPAPPLLERSRLLTNATRGSSRPDDGRVVVVTGGASGIGRATALAFAARGADLVIADVDRAGAEQTADRCRERGVDANAAVVDVSSQGAMEAFAQSVADRYGAPDVVVNNAGIGVAGPLLDTSVETWERVIGVNLWGVLHGSRLFGKQMVDRGQGGHIVNLASAAAFAPSALLPAYATTKVAVRMLSECLRAELAPEGIGVSAICPGLIDTPITTRTSFVGVSDEEQDRRREASAKLYRWRGLGPEVVAQAIVRATLRDEAVVPVSIEAHALDVLGRYAPSLARGFAKLDLSPR